MEIIIVTEPDACAPCKYYELTVQEMKREYPRIVTVLDRNEALRLREFPKQIPFTLIRNKSTGKLWTQVGPVSKEEFKRALDSLRSP